LAPQNRQIRSYIQTMNIKLEGYSHPHIAPQWIPMGNCRMEHHQSCNNKTPPIMSKATTVETQKQHVGLGITQSLNADITTT